jgi:hypothetical protein
MNQYILMAKSMNQCIVVYRSIIPKHGMYQYIPVCTSRSLFQMLACLPSSCPQAARRHHRAKQHHGYIGRGKSVYCAFQLISCQPRLWTRPRGLGENQAVTIHRQDSSSWVGEVGELKLKVMVEGGRSWARAR